MTRAPVIATACGVEFKWDGICYHGELGPFDARIAGDGTWWRWRLEERSPPGSQRPAVIGSGRYSESPEEAAAHMDRCVGLFAFLPRGAST